MPNSEFAKGTNGTQWLFRRRIDGGWERQLPEGGRWRALTLVRRSDKSQEWIWK